jgi:hypothetical protein
MKRVLLAEGDDLLRVRTQSLRFGQSGLDPVMLDQGAGLVGQQGVAVRLAPAKFDSFPLVTHMSEAEV